MGHITGSPNRSSLRRRPRPQTDLTHLVLTFHSRERQNEAGQDHTPNTTRLGSLNYGDNHFTPGSPLRLSGGANSPDLPWSAGPLSVYNVSAVDGRAAVNERCAKKHVVSRPPVGQIHFQTLPCRELFFPSPTLFRTSLYLDKEVTI